MNGIEVKGSVLIYTICFWAESTLWIQVRKQLLQGDLAWTLLVSVQAQRISWRGFLCCMVIKYL